MRIRIPLALIICIAPAWPQQSQPEISSQETPVTFSSRVNLVSVPVVVRDREGNAIGNLKQEDFQLFDKGKPQVITKFTVEKTEGAQAATPVAQPGRTVEPVRSQPTLPDRYVAYLVDDIHLTRGDLLNARQAMNRHLDEALDPSSRAAIFTTSGIVLSDFTSDREKLHKAVNRVQPWTSGPDPQQDCPPVSYYMADMLVNKLLYLSGYLFTDQQLIALITSGQADQSLLAVVSEAQMCFGLTTGLDSNIMIQVRTIVRQVLTYGDRETLNSLGAIKDVVRRLSAMPGSRNLVLVSPGFLLTQDHRVAEHDVFESAIRANVTINSIDMRGLYAPIAGGDASTHGYSSSYAGYLTQADISAASDAGSTLAEMADGTGGKFFHDDNGLKEGLNQIAARPEYLYVLGFSPQNLKLDGTYHALKVSIRNVPGATLQARRGYWAPNHAVDAAEAAKEEITDAIFSRDQISEIPVDLQTEFFKSADEKVELTVVAHVNADGLHFRKVEDRNNDTVTVVTGLFDENGNFVSGLQRVVTLHLRDKTLASVQKSGIEVKEVFNVAPGRYVVRLVVRDGEGRAMAARSGGVEIP